MKRPSVFNFICMLALVPGLTYGAPYEVDLDKDTTLLGIFQSGLRPTQIYGLESTHCELNSPVSISFRVGELNLPPVEAVWEIKLNGNGRLRVINGETFKSWDVKEAFDAVAPLETALSGDSARMLKWLEGYPESSINGECWGRTKRGPDDLKIGYYFRHSMDPGKPFRFTFYIHWDIKQVEIVRAKAPLKPPPGFEDFDMRPRDVQNYEKWQKEEAAKLAQAKLPISTPAPSNVPEAKTWPWWICLLAFLILAVIGIAWDRRKRGGG